MGRWRGWWRSPWVPRCCAGRWSICGAGCDPSGGVRTSPRSDEPRCDPMGGLTVALACGAVGVGAGWLAARLGRGPSAMALCLVLLVAALGLWIASLQADDMRGLAYAALLTVAALPALGGAVIGGA